MGARLGARREFRTDAEGLRAVAVLAVVLYHAGLPAARGGYVGVDVFFVLSGFLITGLIWRELRQTGRVSFASFYARRVRRLLPAAVLVLVVTAVAAMLLLSPLQARIVARDATAAALYVANYRFAVLRNDYLTSEAPPSPLQHYWSLGVEEQFYVFWPLLLLAASLAWRRPGRVSVAAASAALALVGAASFALSLWLTAAAQPWAFYSLPTRAWELALGGMAALAVPSLRRLPPAVAAALGWLGLAGIVWSVTRLGESTPFPGVAALIPAGGAVMLLSGGCAAPRLGPDVVLRRGPFQFAGRISYSWYLWHWPVLVLAPVVAGRALELWARLALAAVSGVLALATVTLVENPVRFSAWLRKRPRRSLAVGAVLTTVAATTAVATSGALRATRGGDLATAVEPPAIEARGADGARARGASTEEQRSVARAVARAVTVRAVPSNLDPALEDAYGDKARPFVDGCHDGFTDARVHPCVYGDQRSARTLVLFGDSHAGQWFPALDRVATAQRWRLVSLTKSTCPPVSISLWSPVLDRPYRECDQWRKAALERIRAERPALVVLGVARHYGREYRFGPVYGPAWVSGLRDMVARVRASGARVAVLGPTPRPRGDVPGCLSEHLTDAGACVQPLERAVNAAGLRAERAAVVAAGGGYLDITPLICTRTTCAVIVGNLLVFRDDNHLSRSYTSWLAPVLAAELGVEVRGARAVLNRSATSG